jgi:outer membrane immunogenic protein
MPYRLSRLSPVFVSGVIAVALTQIASAADLPRKAPAAAPPLPMYSWTGFYVGGNIGYGWGNGDTDFIPLPTAAGFINLAPTTLSTDPKGVIGGIQLGYNWQMATWVFGVEADFQGSGIKGDVALSPFLQNTGATFNGTLSASEDIKWFGTLRGRVGYLVTPAVLLYATGGLAYGHVDYAANANFTPQGTQQYPAAFSKTKAGWTAGAGVEWAFANNWSVKFEYLYFDLGDESTIANGIPGLAGGSCGGGPTVFCQVGYNWETTGNIVRGGVNYKF